jgi:hypothetical protein
MFPKKTPHWIEKTIYSAENWCEKLVATWYLATFMQIKEIKDIIIVSIQKFIEGL